MCNRRGILRLSAAFAIISLCLAASSGVVADIDKACRSSLAEGFVKPPMSARPRAYWDWTNGYVNLAQLRRELEDIKEKGLSGFDIFDVGGRDREKRIPAGPAFMSAESVEAAGYAIREAGRLGLRMGFITSSSWNAGGSWVTPAAASKALYAADIRVSGSRRFYGVLPFPKVPAPKFGPNRTPRRADGLPFYYKDVAVLAFPWNEEKIIKDTSTIINLTKYVGENGRLTWDVPEGEWVIMRLVCANNGERLAIPSPNSDGFMIDHFNAEATQMHFEYIINKLQEALGDLSKTALKFMYLPSYEIRGTRDWTESIIEEFKKRRGYDMTPYLPVLFGWSVGSKETASRFDYDRLATVSDLIIENHYEKAAEICHKYGLQLCAESGGPGPPLHDCPVESLRALGVLDIPRGEFWNQHTTRVVKEIACASHIYGKKIVDMEAFTSWRHWQDGPFEYKGVADRAMCEGTNLFTFHTSPHTPPEAGKPGWTYHAGTHMGMNRAWWPKVKPFIDYLSRCSYLLQQGLFVGDVCYYYGDQAPNFVANKYAEKPPDFAPQRLIDPSLGYGYDYDVTNTDVLLNRMRVKKGRIILPDGMSYALLVLPNQEDMPLKVLRKLAKMVKAGATIVGPKPTRVPGLGNYKKRGKKLRRLAKKLWGPCDGEKVTEHRYGKGKIILGRTLREILQDKGTGQDFSFAGGDDKTELDYIHRRTDNADIYFVINNKNRWEQVDCVFRVSGKVPELWMPDTGRIQRLPVYQSVKGGTRVTLRLGPAGSVFVVFREKVKENNIIAVSRNNKSIFPVSPAVKPRQARIEVLEDCAGKVAAVARDGGTYVFETADGKKIKKQIMAPPQPIEISGPWEVNFPYGWGAPPAKTFEKLISWTEDTDEGIKYFSGIAAYRKEFEIGQDFVGSDTKIVLDLGRVRNIAEVYVNGKNLGILWKEPFEIDITCAAKAGKNHLVIEVVNVWSNRLVGDARATDGRKYCQTNIRWPVTSRYFPRVRWAQAELLESGLLGPVRLRCARKVELKLAQ